MEGIGIVNGTLTRLDASHLPLTDRGHLLGDGIFETLRAAKGRVYRLADHAERWKNGLNVLGLPQRLNHEFQETVATLLAEGQEIYGDSLYIRVQASGGLMRNMEGVSGAANISAICRPYRPVPADQRGRGMKLHVASARKSLSDPLSAIKHLSFLPFIHARREAMAKGSDDAVILNEQGRVAEASTSNLFALKDGRVYAPGADEGALSGVTRQVVLEWMQDAGLEVSPSMSLAILRDADEAFLTNTTAGIVPVISVEGSPVGSGNAGDVTLKLAAAYEESVQGQDQ